MIIYFDMDGVLCEFYPKYKALLLECNSDNKTFEEFVKRKYFEDLPKLDIGERLLEFITNLELTKSGYIRVGILSSTASQVRGPAFGREVTRQKLKWLSANYPNIQFEPTIFVTNKEKKQLFATPDSILIDDLAQNVCDFIDSGGLGVQVSSESNYAGIKNTIEKHILEIRDKQYLF